MHSVERRFIANVCGAMLVFVAPLIVLFLYISSDRITRERLQNAGVLLEAGASALGKPLWDLDMESTARTAHALIADHDIVKVDVSDTTGTTLARFPGDRIQIDIPHVTLSKAIVYDGRDGQVEVGKLVLWVQNPGISSRFSADEIGVLAILLVAVAIVFAAAIVGNRIIVIRPLIRLTQAIDATRTLGSRHRVEWQSQDEMGALVEKFNEMQYRLEIEQNALREAHAHATEIYNTTPAMLFSINAGDRIVAVSDYWLTATGYMREEVLGQPFATFIEPEAHDLYDRRRQTSEVSAACEVTVPFRKADGSFMTVLILETHGPAETSAQETSLAVMADVTALKQAESRNHIQAITDHLTGLLNRQGFEAALDAGIRLADAQASQMACIFIDLDRFKWINDNFGHAAGDDVLRQVVARIRATLRPADTMSRLGGDEFAILIDAPDVADMAGEISDRICMALSVPIVVKGTELSVSCSVGIALYPVHASSAADLLLKSDIAMYARKHDGKNGKAMFDPSMLDAARERREMEQHIELGLKNDWFDAYLQPIVGMADGRIAGFEALMRLNHPDKGIIGPARIIGIAEETGLIGKIGDRIMEKSIRYLARITALEGASDTYLAINFSPLQFEETLPHKLAALLLKYQIAPTRIVVEITEAVLMLDNQDVHAVLRQLCEFGCRIALDDFGTGYSSLSYLNRFPVNIVKVDQSFVRSLTSESSDVRRKSRMLIKGIRTISSQMGYVTVAEGIETKEDWQSLKKLGLDFGQGYLFSRPMPIDDMLAMLENNSEAKASAAG